MFASRSVWPLVLLLACDGPASTAASSAPDAAASATLGTRTAASPSSLPTAPSAPNGAGPEGTTAILTYTAKPSAPPSAPSTDAPPVVSGSASTPPGKDRGVVSVKALLDGFKKDPAAWVGSQVKTKGAVTGYTLDKFTLDAKGVHGPDVAGTRFGVHLADPEADRGIESVTCFVEEGADLAAVRAAFDKKNVATEEVVVDVSGRVEASFGGLAPCKIGKPAIAKRKAKK